ncbi:MAG: hypothetical protein WDO24_22960 [Pseudomonadota bacterium]
MGRHPHVMNALIRFSNLLAPVLSDGPDAATVAILASNILDTRKLRDVDVIPLSAAPELTENTLFALQSGVAHWHAVRLLIDQGKLPPDPRIHVRVHLNQAQWDKAGEIAHEAADEHPPGPRARGQARQRARKGARKRRTLVLSVV